MKNFVILFRQGPPPLTESDKQHRAAETATWARKQNETGHQLDPRILAQESAHRGPKDPTSRPDTWPVTALLFLQARDLSEAAAIAAAHPATRYGANVEVRPWDAPVPAKN